MHLVTPKVWLISMPSIDFDAMREYLEDVGGESWLDRVEGTMEPADLLAEFAGRSCYRSWEPGLNPNVTRVRDDSQEYIRNILSSAHGSVAEHPSFGVRLFDVDTLDDMARPAALAEGYGWQPTFRLRFPQGRSVDMHLGGGL